MSNDFTLNPIDEPTAPAAPQMTLGQWLQQSRTASGLSVQDVALRTSRTVAQITELEADDFKSFSAHVVLRGMIRQYTKVVGADENTALQLVPDEFKPANNLEWIGLKGNDIPVQKRKIPASGSRWWMWVLTAVVIGLLIYWVFVARYLKNRDTSAKVGSPNQVQITAQPTPVVTDVPKETAPAPTPAPTTDATAPTTVQTPPTPTDNTVAATGGNTLNLKFTGLVYVEVRDADGKKLLSANQQPNTEQTIQGAKTPLYVKIADGTKAQMTWKGQPYDLAPIMKGNGTVVRIKNLE